MTNFFSHAQFQAPLARARSRASDVWRLLFALSGRYRPLSAAETATEPAEVVPYKGDIPLTAGKAHEQQRLLFREPRPPFEAVENLVVTPAGAGWKDGTLFEKYAASKPGLRMLLASNKPEATAPAGFFVQSEHTDTFGDWNSEYLASLARAGAIDAPVFLPGNMASKGYVRRDAARAGIEVVAIDKPILIEKAKVVRQGKFIRYWRPEDVEAYRRFLNIAPLEPEPGSILYLSRHGEVSEVANRTHPNLAVEAAVKEKGGRVLRTRETNLEGYIAAAATAETLLYDHGSAAYNMVFYRPRRTIEFVSDDWWLNAFIMFADSIGVKDYTVIRSDLGAPEEVAARTAAALDRPIET